MFNMLLLLSIDLQSCWAYQLPQHYVYAIAILEVYQYKVLMFRLKEAD